ncbi:hypothetical protein EUTSA_v10009182mg [Eutrema salsugineum]|uniref:Uncharacterized protein n=1 Tax=Eutrema salsugineum TaxID=72664 RepID=V4L496_EUTSA|nr:hypothetical protein EUTSA_v10009182mg [Eutrema salsugineum]
MQFDLKPRRKTNNRAIVTMMSAQKFQLASLLLVISLLFSQSAANRCIYKGPSKTDDDCKKICTGPGEDPSFLLCITGPPMNGKCCCKHPNQKDSLVLP